MLINYKPKLPFQPGWWDIGYHYLIGQDGFAYEGRGWDHQGAQVKRWNKVSLGISVMGNFMNITPNTAALDVVKGLIDCALKQVNDTAPCGSLNKRSRPDYCRCIFY